MTCAQVTELLAAFADGGLEGREHDQVTRHVADCAACAAEVRTLREVLASARRLDERPAKDEVFWQDLQRDVRLAVAAPVPAPWWRLPAVVFGFALAVAAVFVTYVHNVAAPPAAPAIALPKHAPRPLPPSFDIDDLDGDSLAAVRGALERGIDGNDEEPGDDELAVAAFVGADELIDNLDDDDLARLRTAL